MHFRPLKYHQKSLIYGHGLWVPLVGHDTNFFITGQDYYLDYY